MSFVAAPNCSTEITGWCTSMCFRTRGTPVASRGLEVNNVYHPPTLAGRQSGLGPRCALSTKSRRTQRFHVRYALDTGLDDTSHLPGPRVLRPTGYRSRRKVATTVGRQRIRMSDRSPSDSSVGARGILNRRRQRVNNQAEPCDVSDCSVGGDRVRNRHTSMESMPNLLFAKGHCLGAFEDRHHVGRRNHHDAINVAEDEISWTDLDSATCCAR